jgi:hypothetical protein
MPGRIANVRFSQKAIYKYMTAFTPIYPLTTVGTGFVLDGPANGILATWVSNIASLGFTATSTPTFGLVGAVGSNIPPSETSYDTASGNAWLGPLYKSFYALSSVDWTIEGWFYQTVRSGTQTAVLIDFSNYGQSVVTGQKPLVLILDTDGTPSIVGYNNTVGQTTRLPGHTVALNTWTHIVWMRSSGYLYAYVNGQKTAGVALPTWLDVFNMMNLITIGTASNQITTNSYHFTGQLSQVMVRLGAKYTTTFTPTVNLTPSTSDASVLFFLGRKREDTVSGLTMPTVALSTSTLAIGARPIS